MPPARLQNIIKYTTLAASVAASVGVPILASVSALTLAILKTVQTGRANKEQCLQLLDEIHPILCVIIGIYSTSTGRGGLTTAMLRDIASFMETLQKIHSFLKSQQDMGKIKQLFKQSEIVSRLDACQAELRESLEKFQIQAGIRATIDTFRMQRDAKQQHEELIALIAAHPDLTNSEQSSGGTRTTISVSGQSSLSLTLLPASPHIFHGRESEVRDVMDVLLQDIPARIAILGPGGMGKTALATAVLHHPDVVAKYKERHFVSCHATATFHNLVSLLADHLGVEQGPSLARRVVSFLECAPPRLLVLDNFETPWEGNETRSEVEDFLSTVTGATQVALMITMRGAERPAKVKWTRPFLLPLRPLGEAAARQMFIDIADDRHDESLVTQVLQRTGNLPLAVSLVASVVSHEGCEKTLSRWNSEKTRLLSDGYDKESSLEISLSLSLTSSRMTPDAQALLSLLSILPDGIAQDELLKSNLPISNILTSKFTLIKTSLVYSDGGKRLMVLPPVRDYVCGVYPPSSAFKTALRHHYHEVVALWDVMHASDKVTDRLMANFNNLRAVFSDALSTGCEDLRQTLMSSLRLDQFAQFMNRMDHPLLGSFEPYLADLGEDTIYGVYLAQRMCTAEPSDDLATTIARGNEYFERADLQDRTKWFFALGHYYTGRDQTAAIHWFRQAISAGSVSGTPSRFVADALTRLADVLNTMGEHTAARTCAQEARKHAVGLGALFKEAHAVATEAMCGIMLGDFAQAASLLSISKQLLIACGLPDSCAHSFIELKQAEVLLLKTEYAEARRLNEKIAQTFKSAGKHVARIKIALIDIQTDGEAGRIYAELDSCRALFKGQLAFPLGTMICDATYVDLRLREGNTREAKADLEKYFKASQQKNAGMEIFCLERLADIELGWNNLAQTTEWAVIFLLCAFHRRNRLAEMKALRCLGSIFAAQSEVGTALTLFAVARDGFAAMGVFRSHADCLRGMAEIFANRGDFATARDLWLEARPLYERCQQQRAIGLIDTKVQNMEAALGVSGRSLGALPVVR